MGSSSSSPGSMPRDNPTHRSWDKALDAKFGGNALYDKYARPTMHGTYHAGRAVVKPNYADWARAKDIYSAIGTGQNQTEYLETYRAEVRAEKPSEKK